MGTLLLDILSHGCSIISEVVQTVRCKALKKTHEKVTKKLKPKKGFKFERFISSNCNIFQCYLHLRDRKSVV